MAFLIDSDQLIDALAGRVDAVGLLNRLPPREMRISVVTYGEVLEAAFNSANPQARIATMRRLLGATELLPVTEPIMVRFAEIRATSAGTVRSSRTWTSLSARRRWSTI